MAIIVEVNGAEIEFPDTMSPEQIQAVISGYQNKAPSKPKFQANAGDYLESALQGATFGWSDELQAGMKTGAGLFGDYEKERAAIDDRQRQFRDSSPGAAITGELLGGVTTGGVLGAKALLSPAVKAMKPIVKAGVTSLLGAVEGGLYGAGKADPGERVSEGTEGAAIGAVAAPLLGYAGEKVINGIGHTGKFLANKMTETPRDQAIRAIRSTVDKSGLTPDDVVQGYKNLGPRATLMDVDENLLQQSRSLMDNFGPMKREARNFVEARQLGSVDRLGQSIKQNITGDDALDTMKEIAKRRSDQAAPLYEKAMGLPATNKLVDLAEARPTLKRALATGRKMAADMGDVIETQTTLVNGKPTPIYDLKQFHYAKMAIDNEVDRFARSGESTKMRAAMTLKKDLLAAMDEASPDYGQARQIFADESSLMNAIEKGRDFFKMPLSEYNDTVKAMTQGEREMFKQGAVRALLDKLDTTQLTHDSAKKLVNTKANQAKLSALFDSPDDAAAFIQQAAIEARFTRTRQAIVGGSPTAERLQAGKEIQQNLNDGASVATNIASGNPVGAAVGMINRMFGDKPASPEMIQEASKLLLAQGLTEAQIRQVLIQSPIIQQATRIGQAVPGVTRGAAVPAYHGLLGGQE